MGALGGSISADLVLLGFSDPREYSAGSFVDDSGREVKFAAGKSMRVYLAPADPASMDVAVCKVKSDDVDRVYAEIRELGRGVVISCEYSETRGQYRLHAVRGVAAHA